MYRKFLIVVEVFFLRSDNVDKLSIFNYCFLMVMKIFVFDNIVMIFEYFIYFLWVVV